MAGLCWMVAVLAFFLSTENTLADVDQNRLAEIVDGILKKYQTDGKLSLAVRIPDDQNQNIDDILETVSKSDPVGAVKEKLNKNEVYIGRRLVAARLLGGSEGGDQAESRVVDHLDDLFNHSNKQDAEFLLLYAYASPCVEKCTSGSHRENILKRMNHILQWSNYAVVFSKISKPSDGRLNTEEELSGALERLGTYNGTRGAIGLSNIFRCDKQDGRMNCTSCSSDDQVAHSCVSDETMSGPSPSQPPTPSTGSQGGVDNGSEKEDEGAPSSQGSLDNGSEKEDEGAPSSQGSLDNGNDNNVIPNGGVPPSEGGPENDIEKGEIPNGGAPPSQGGKCRGMRRRKGCNGRGMRRRRRQRGRGLRRHRGGKGRGMGRRRGGTAEE
ncbi:uncharacterized protein LOC119017828 [Acanthopagrus latus]|uniref:uncharacterized protein LOC119017828 n=1 Tax=Acanthopagrus latus TaxID=8177 RepID=UPI00187C606C|nr:uncharacterized protein LOC119017828 [Acanthopagrus latus]